MFLFEIKDYIEKLKEKEITRQYTIGSGYYKSISTFYLSIVSIVEKRMNQQKGNRLKQIFNITQNEDIKKLTCAFIFKRQLKIIGKIEYKADIEIFNFYEKNQKDIDSMVESLVATEGGGIQAKPGNVYLEVLMSDFTSEMNELKEFDLQNLNLIVLSLASSFEILVAGLLKHDLMYITPNGGWISKLQRSYGELKDLDNIEDVKLSYATKYVDSQIYKNFDDWFENAFEILTSKKNGEIDKQIKKEVSEFYQRRNLIVHNNNVVNNVYNEKANKTLEIGSNLGINESYLRKQIDNIAKLGSQLIFGSLYKSKYYQDVMMMASLNNLGITILNHGNPELSRDIFSGIFFADIEREKLLETKITASQCVHLCNIWLTYVIEKKDGIFKNQLTECTENGVLDDVKDDEQVRMALKILNGDTDSLDYVKPFVEKIEHTRDKILVLKWPIFNLLSKNNNFVDYTKKIYYS